MAMSALLCPVLFDEFHHIIIMFYADYCKTEGKLMNAKDIMSQPVVTVTEDIPVSQIAEIILERRISALPVVNGAGKLVGLVSASDLLERADIGTDRKRHWLLEKIAPLTAARAYTKSRGLCAKDVMTRQLVSVGDDAGLIEIVGKMADRGVQRVIVVDADKPVGMLSRRDVLRAVIAAEAADKPSEADAEIKQGLLDDLSLEAWFKKSRIQISVVNGIVTLSGVVFSPEERAALRLAVETRKSVRGVNDITVAEFA